jgi:hypothetical protein
VRRDRLFLLFRQYGWIAGVVVLLIVGGAAWNEYSKAQERAQAEDLGDSILAALGERAASERQAKIAQIEASGAGAQSIVRLLLAAEAQQAGETEAAVEALDMLAVNADVAPIYRQIAAFKSLVLQADQMDPALRRQQFEAMAAPGMPMSLLSQEQLGLMEIEEGRTQAAIDRFQAIVQDAGVSPDLQQRALQVIVALGGTPQLDGLPGLDN